MKKNYQKPEIQVVLLQHRAYLLNGSPSPQRGRFVDDTPNDHVWNDDGGQ